jgi:hypothetical protein
MTTYEAEQLIRGLMESYGCGSCNLIFYNQPSPLGISVRNSIGISIPLCEFCTPGVIGDVTIHELSHQFCPDDFEHGSDFQHQARMFGLDPNEEMRLDPTFKRLHDGFVGNEALHLAGRKRLIKIKEFMEAWADAGVQGKTDRFTFASEVKIPEKANSYPHTHSDTMVYATRATDADCIAGCMFVNIPGIGLRGVAREGNRRFPLEGKEHRICSDCDKRDES